MRWRYIIPHTQQTKASSLSTNFANGVSTPTLALGCYNRHPCPCVSLVGVALHDCPSRKTPPFELIPWQYQSVNPASICMKTNKRMRMSRYVYCAQLMQQAVFGEGREGWRAGWLCQFWKVLAASLGSSELRRECCVTELTLEFDVTHGNREACRSHWWSTGRSLEIVVYFVVAVMTQ